MKPICNKEKELFIVNMYTKQNKSAIVIGKEMNIKYCTIYSILSRNGVKMRTNKENYKLKFNDDFFKNIDSEEKAYFLGFLAADGCIIKPKRSSYVMKLQLSYVDSEILYKFCDCIGLPRERVRFYRPYSSSYKNSKKTCRLLIPSDKFCLDLMKHGVTQRKTETMKFPEKIRKNMIRHYIRGYFDGDGSISSEKFRIDGTNNMIEGIQKFMMHELGLSKTKITKRKKESKSECCTLCYGGRVQLVKIREWLYANSTIFLNRKYKSFVKYGVINA